MKENVCLVCLKIFQSFSNDGPCLSPSPPQVEKCGAPLLTKFLKFAKNYLKVSSPVSNINRSTGETFPDAFCEKCELAVITPICQVYLEFLSAQLRLSWELEQLGKLLDNSQPNMSNQTRVMNMTKLSDQMGVKGPSKLEEFRSLLSQKCQLKRKQTLPVVRIKSRCSHNQINMLRMDSLSEGNDDDSDDDDEDFDPLDLGVMDPLDMQSDENESEEASGVAHTRNVDVETMMIEIKVDPAQVPQDDNYITSAESDQDQEEVDDDGCQTSGPLDNWEKCSKCERFFESMIGLNRHNSTCLGIKKQTTNKAKDLAGATVVFPCGVCVKIFPTRRSRNDHKSRFHTTKRYSCPKCPFLAKTRSALGQHFIEVHNSQPVVCSQCSKTFKTTRYLKRHFRQAHLFPGKTIPVISHACPNSTCDSHFPTKAMLNCHLTECSYAASAPEKNEVNVRKQIKIEEAF